MLTDVRNSIAIEHLLGTYVRGKILVRSTSQLMGVGAGYCVAHSEPPFEYSFAKSSAILTSFRSVRSIVLNSFSL